MKHRVDCYKKNEEQKKWKREKSFNTSCCKKKKLVHFNESRKSLGNFIYGTTTFTISTIINFEVLLTGV